MSVVLDASAILAFVQNEDGAGVVEAALLDASRCGAALCAQPSVRSAWRCTKLAP